jgi:AraC-like DNA-binding protein
MLQMPLTDKDKRQIPAFISRQTGRHKYFFPNVPEEIFNETDLVVACGGWEQCSPNYVVERPGFRFHAVEFVAQGRGLLHILGTEYKLLPGMFFAYGPDIPHRISCDSQAPLWKYFVAFGGNRAEELVRKLQSLGPVRAMRGEFVRMWFEQLLEIGGAQTAGDSNEDDPRTMALLVELIVRHATAKAPPGDARVLMSRTVYERCLMLLRANFLTLPSAEALARMAYLDVAYMTRLFRYHGNESPYRMLVRLKIDHAANRIITEARKLEEIGAEVGFPNPYHFSRVFKRVHGMSPKAFRESYRR